MTELFWQSVPTPLGVFVVGGTAEVICAVKFPTSAAPERPAAPAPALLITAATQLNELLSGQRQHIDLPLASRGTEFQQRIWCAIEEIPFGQTATYGQLASAIGAPRAARAVGAACGANPIPILRPCHRVVAANGLGGFAGGLDLKRALLDLEAGAADPPSMARR
jgi:methylated-DNA-[protein]-cysteine S-methyltransferase